MTLLADIHQIAEKKSVSSIEAGSDRTHSSASVHIPTGTETHGVAVTDKKEPEDEQTHSAGTVANSATSSNAEQKTNMSHDTVKKTSSPDHQEVFSGDAEKKTHITQAALEKTGATTQGHQEAKTPPIPPVSYRGLFNKDKMCYQNSTYQCLSKLKGLREHLDQLPWSQAATPDLHQILRWASQTGNIRRALPRARSSL